MNAPAPARALGHRERISIVAGALLPVFMASMDQTVVASALPTIGKALGSPQHLGWVIAANLLTATAATPLYGKISDIAGRRATLLAAVSLFTLGALVAALSVNLPMLIVGRALQGAGAGGMSSVPMTILGDIAPPKDRARYYTYFSIVYITSGALGPAFGGFASQHAHWSVIFWVNVPIGLLALALMSALLKQLPRYERPHRLDLLGAGLVVLATTASLFVLNAGGHEFAWRSAPIGLAAATAALLWVAFVRRLLTAAEPLIPLGVLAHPVVLCATIANAVGWSAVISLNIYLPLFLQSVHGYSPTDAGLSMMALMVTVNGSALIGSYLAGRLTHYKRPPMASLVVCVIACVWLALRAADIGGVEFAIVLGSLGLGFGALAPVTTVAIQNAVPLHQLGVALGVMAFCRSLLATTATAVFGAILFSAAIGGAGGAARFAIVFVASAGLFCVSFAALFLMRETPLMTTTRA